MSGRPPGSSADEPASREPAPDEPAPDEVRRYVRRLLLTISVGVVLMASAAIWAYSTYGKKLERGAPLPPGTPPMASDSAAGPP